MAIPAVVSGQPVDSTTFGNPVVDTVNVIETKFVLREIKDASIATDTFTTPVEDIIGAGITLANIALGDQIHIDFTMELAGDNGNANLEIQLTRADNTPVGFCQSLDVVGVNKKGNLACGFWHTIVAADVNNGGVYKLRGNATAGIGTVTQIVLSGAHFSVVPAV